MNWVFLFKFRSIEALVYAFLYELSFEKLFLSLNIPFIIEKQQFLLMFSFSGNYCQMLHGEVKTTVSFY